MCATMTSSTTCYKMSTPPWKACWSPSWWEGFVVEQIVGAAPPLTEFSFYRTAAGAEMDLVATLGGRSVGYEIKLSSAPTVGKGFWHACEDLGVERAYVVAPVAETSSRPVPVETDGEAAGQLPATFEILPRALNLRC